MAFTALVTAPADDRKQQIMAFMAGFSAETTPGAAARTADFRAHLRPGSTVYITFLPGSQFEDTVRVAARLAREGFEPVPHIAARSIPDRAWLDRQLARLTQESGVREVLAVGGGISRPIGAFDDTMQMLATGLFDRHGITRIGLAGHPEGSPDISDAAIRAALAWKNEFARRSDAQCYLITQFCFQAAPVIAWSRRINAQGNHLPVYVGLPGLASIKTLIAHAKACGVGPSLRFLTRQARSIATLMRVSAPDRQVCALAAHAGADPGCGIAGVHLFPLGGLTRTARWGRAVVDGDFTLHADARGFDVNVELCSG